MRNYFTRFVLIILAPLIYYKLKARLEKRKEQVKNPDGDENVVSSGTYVVDEKDNKLFYSTKKKDVRIRLIKTLKNDFDELTLSTSYPHNFQESHVKALIKSIPQVANCFTVSSVPHNLIIYKSPAASFDDIQDMLLRFVFRHLEVEWTAEEINDQWSMCTK